jgi:predicted GIY-YIG superfamily endonuclease
VTWTVYLIRCGDGTLYAGITNHLARRMAAHRKGRGARYTRGRGPFRVVLTEEHASKGDALRRELDIKRLRRRAKQALIAARRARRRPSSGSGAPSRR